MIRYWAITFVILIYLASCYDPDKFEEFEPNTLLRPISIIDTAIADGRDPVSLVIQASNDIDRNKYKAKLTTNRGIFLQNGMDTASFKMNQDHQFTAKIVSTSVGKIMITMEIDKINISDETSSYFKRSYPQGILIYVDSFAIQPNFENEILISAQLSKKNGGLPSQGHEVTFTVSDSIGREVGFFLNNNKTAKTDAKGLARIRYAMDNSPYRGRLSIQGQTIGENDTIHQSETIIYLTKE